jgi:hypothetical protein
MSQDSVRFQHRKSNPMSWSQTVIVKAKHAPYGVRSNVVQGPSKNFKNYVLDRKQNEKSAYFETRSGLIAQSRWCLVRNVVASIGFLLNSTSYASSLSAADDDIDWTWLLCHNLPAPVTLMSGSVIPSIATPRFTAANFKSTNPFSWSVSRTKFRRDGMEFDVARLR